MKLLKKYTFGKPVCPVICSKYCILRKHTGGKTWLRKCLVLLALLFAFLQLNFLLFHISADLRSYTHVDVPSVTPTVAPTVTPSVLHKLAKPKPNNLTALRQNMTTIANSILKISQIKENIARNNLEQIVYNEAIFKPLQDDSIVIVVQIHNRITYLQHLLASLAQVRGISNALIIFSHDIYDEEINSLILDIDFCKVMQIFYPYSIQTHPKEFPGDDPNDCPRDISPSEAFLKECNNALHPDKYGHYREARVTQAKHHWWWKANMVFNQLDVTRNHKGLFAFLEEDNYVAEDFIYVLLLMERTCRELHQRCDILSTATDRNNYVRQAAFNKVAITQWIISFGCGFNRTTWKVLANCSEYFCKYDDYNYDWSLRHLSEMCLKQKLQVMHLHNPRVYHIGECGMHHKKTKCEPEIAISKIQNYLKSVNGNVYPENLTLTPLTMSLGRMRQSYGGWGDIRDHNLCMNMTNMTIR